MRPSASMELPAHYLIAADEASCLPFPERNAAFITLNTLARHDRSLCIEQYDRLSGLWELAHFGLLWKKKFDKD